MRKLKNIFLMLCFAFTLFGSGVVVAQTSWREFWEDVRVRGRFLNDGTARFLSAVEMNNSLQVDGNATVNGDLTVAGDITLTSDVTLTTDLNLDDGAFLRAEPGAVQNLWTTAGLSGSQVDEITPTGLFNRVATTATGGVGTSIAAPEANGLLIIVRNVGAESVTITDTAPVNLVDGNTALLADGTIMFVSEDDEWWQLPSVIIDDGD